MSTVAVVKKVVDGAATAASKLDAFAKASEKALADGKTLNFFEDAVQGVKLFGQANIALQCLSMGLMAIGKLMGDKTQEDLILDGVHEVLGRIKTLESDIHKKFDQLAIQLNVQTGKLELQPYLIKIQAAESYFDQIQQFKRQGKDFSTLQADLSKVNPTQFVEAMDQIYDSCVGSGTPTSPNIFDEIYALSFGDIRKILPIGEYLLHKATAALMLHGLVDTLNSTTSSNQPSDQIAALYEDKIKAVADAFATCAAKCLSPTDRQINIKKYLDAKKVVPLALLADDKQGSATRIVAGLQEQYEYLNFSVIVYEAVSGFDRHGVTGSNDSWMAEFRYADITGKPLNIVIYWANRTATNRQDLITYQSAVVDWHVFPGPRKDRSFDVTKFSSWPNRPPGARYQFVFDLATDANHSTNNSIFFGNWGHKQKDLNPFLDRYNNETDRTKREDNSLVWFCFSDEYDNANQTFIGMASNNAMYGLVAPYTMICFWAD